MKAAVKTFRKCVHRGRGSYPEEATARVRTHDIEGLLGNLSCVDELGDFAMSQYQVPSYTT
jgi:hypothetical protein